MLPASGTQASRQVGRQAGCAFHASSADWRVTAPCTSSHSHQLHHAGPKVKMRMQCLSQMPITAAVFASVSSGTATQLQHSFRSTHSNDNSNLKADSIGQASKQASKQTHPCRSRLDSVLFACLAQSLLACPLQARHKALGLLLIVFKCCRARPARGGADRPQPSGHFTKRPAHCTGVQLLEGSVGKTSVPPASVL